MHFPSMPLSLTTHRITLRSPAAQFFSTMLLSACLLIATAVFPANAKLSADSAADTEKAEIKLTTRHGYELKIIDKLLDRYHYIDYELDDAMSRQILKSYLDQLDPDKMFFLEQDVEAFKGVEDSLDDYIRAGVVDPAFTIFNIYQTRIQERVDFALERLHQPFDFILDEDYTPEREDENWASDPAALDEIWRKRIKNDLINQLLAKTNEEEALDTLKKRYETIARRTDQLKPDELFQIIANAYLSALEPHTSYFSPRASEEFNIHMRLSLQGIGAQLRGDGEHTEIVKVIKGGPADLSDQVHAGDKITGVAQDTADMVDVIGWRLSDVVDIIRGKKGSEVRLRIVPTATGLSGEPKVVSIIRDTIKLEEQAAKSRIIENTEEGTTTRIGVIDLPSFYIDFDARARGETDYRSTTRDVQKLVDSLKEQSIDGLIIDLRGNGGGSLEEVITLTGLFIDTGPVVQVSDSDGRLKIHYDREEGSIYDGPLAVMVDRASASASEIFSGAIQDYNRGIIVGETTFGKGTVQSVLPLSAHSLKLRDHNQLGQLKVTIAQFFRVNGDSTQFRGVIPDLNWPLPRTDDDAGERSYDNALPWRHIDKAKYTPFVETLDLPAFSAAQNRHLSRSREDPEFMSTVQKLRLLNDSRRQTSVSLNLEKRRGKRSLLNQDLLAVENAIRAARGEPPFKSVQDMQDTQKADRDQPKDDDDKPIDVFLREASAFLSDYIHSASPPANASIAAH